MVSDLPNLNIQYRAIAELRPRTSNARTHSDKQINQIAASIRRFGFVTAILIDSDDGIVAGHGRVEAAKRLGLEQVPTIRIEHLSDAELRAYVLADNRLAELAGWDRNLLALELSDLVQIDTDFDVTVTGFEAAEIDMLLAPDPEPKNDPAVQLPDSTKQTQPVLMASDLWHLGRHRLLCGDATSADAFDRLLDGADARLVFTDPPYNVAIDGHVTGLGAVHHREFAMAAGEMDEAAYVQFLERVFTLLCRHSVNGAIHFVCMDWRHLYELLAAGRPTYSELKNICVWNKSNGGMGSLYRSKHELIAVFKAGTASHINNVELGRHGRNRTNVWDYTGINSFGDGRDEQLAMHPTAKPVQLVADAILDCSQRGDLVLDCFAGSGTTVIACERTGRNARVMEIDPLYCDTIIRRWQNFTGDQAVHAETGQPFDDIEAKSDAERAAVMPVQASTEEIDHG
jgi:DNA modification methylase